MTGPELVASGVVLHADLVGFTPLTQARTAAGPGGVEHLHALLDSSFSGMSRAVERHGGCVVAFAGDALTAVFLEDTGRECRRRARRAAAQVLDVTAQLTDGAAQGSVRSSAQVGSFRVGLGEGEIRRLRVGTAELGRYDVVTGSALVRAVRAQSGALPGQVATAWGGPGPAGDLVVPVGSSQRGSVEAAGSASTAWSGALWADTPTAPGRAATHPSTMPDGAAAEHRMVSTGFVRVGSTRDPGALSAFAPAALRLIASHEGSLRQIDGSGAAFAFVLGFGAPTSTPDDVTASVGCCLRLVRLAQASGLAAAAGVATGEVFCAQLGGAGHREYVVVGDSVNHAARLAARAAPGEVLVDAMTAQRSRSHFVLRTVGSLGLKGRREEVAFGVVGLRGEVPAQAARPAGRPARAQAPDGARVPASTGQLSPNPPDEPCRVCVGRDREFTAVLTIAQRRAGGVLLLRADAGLGKSRLLDLLAEHLPGVVLRGRAGDIGERRPYLPWHQVVRDLLADETRPQGPAGRAAAADAVAADAVPDTTEPPEPDRHDLHDLHDRHDRHDRHDPHDLPPREPRRTTPDDAPGPVTPLDSLPIEDRGFAPLLAEAAGLAPAAPAPDDATPDATTSGDLAPSARRSTGPTSADPTWAGAPSADAPPEGRRSDTAAPTEPVTPHLTLDAQDRAATTRRLVADLVTGRLARGPVIVLLDGAERFDDLSAALARELIGVAQRLPLLIVLAARERPDWLPGDDVRELDLGPLAPAVALRLTRRILGARHPEADEVARHSGGNPLFIVQLAAWVTQASDGSGQVSSGEESPRPPGDLRRLVTARVDRLSRHSRTTLQAAAVMGSAQRRSLLRRCVAELAPDLALDVPGELRRLADLGFLTSADVGATFVDPLVREVIYAGLSVAARARLHETVTHAFERDYGRSLRPGARRGPGEAGQADGPPDDRSVTVEMVAFHAARCPDVQRQRRWLHAAASEAEARYATRSAIDSLDRLLRIERGPSRADLLIRRGAMLALAGRHAEAEADLREAGRTAAATPRDSSSHLGDVRARADCELGVLLLATPRYEEGLALLGSAADRLERAGDLPACLTALDRLAHGRLQHGDTAGAASTAHRQFALARTTHEPGRRAAAAQNLALLAWREGRREEAVRLVRQAHADARRSGDRRLLVHTGNDFAGMLAETGHLAPAAERLTEALDAARQIGYRRATAGMTGNLAELHRRAGHPSSAATIALTGLWEALDLLDCPAIAQLTVNVALSRADAGHPGAAVLLARAGAVAQALDQIDAQLDAQRAAQLDVSRPGPVDPHVQAQVGAPRLPRPRGLLRADDEQIEAAFARAESLVASRARPTRPEPAATRG